MKRFEQTIEVRVVVYANSAAEANEKLEDTADEIDFCDGVSETLYDLWDEGEAPPELD